MTRRIKGGMKRSETEPVSNQFPKCSPPSGTHRDSQSWVEKRRGREETEVTWGRTGLKMGRTGLRMREERAEDGEDRAEGGGAQG